MSSLVKREKLQQERITRLQRRCNADRDAPQKHVDAVVNKIDGDRDLAV
jgi:hypothetical protein